MTTSKNSNKVQLSYATELMETSPNGLVSFSHMLVNIKVAGQPIVERALTPEELQTEGVKRRLLGEGYRKIEFAHKTAEPGSTCAGTVVAFVPYEITNFVYYASGCCCSDCAKTFSVEYTEKLT